MGFLDDLMKPFLDEVAMQIEESLKRIGFPQAEFKFTHEVFEVAKQGIKLEEDFPIPIVYYSRVGDPSELGSNSYLLVTASVLAFGRRQTALVRCIFQRDERQVSLELVGPVEIIETDYFPGEEEEEKKGGLVHMPDWVKRYLHDIIGVLITEAVRAVLKKILKLDP